MNQIIVLLFIAFALYKIIASSRNQKSNMEDLKKILEQSEDYSMSSSEDNETDNEELSVWNLERLGGEVPLATINSNVGGENAIASKKRNGEERLPTRRPDPNVYNRNALLARENRRKKKVYLETIEKELQDARKANRTLLKALKRQLKIARRLEQKNKYIQSIFANRSDILSVITALKIRRLPSESDKSPFSATSNFDYESTYNCRGELAAVTNTSCSSSSHDPDSLSIHFDNLSDDLEDAAGCNLPTTTSWDDLWNNGYHNTAIDVLPLPISFQPPRNDNIQTVNDDHCYVASITLDPIQTSGQQSEFSSTSPRSECSLDLDVGTDDVASEICLHVVGGKVSMEFCPTCHWSSTNSRTPPFQLFNDER